MPGLRPMMPTRMGFRGVISVPDWLHALQGRKRMGEAAAAQLIAWSGRDAQVRAKPARPVERRVRKRPANPPRIGNALPTPARRVQMRSFQLIGLESGQFEHLFNLTDSELEARNIRRLWADADFGFPCRICLEDARSGDELLLLPFQHQPAPGPYQASG